MKKIITVLFSLIFILSTLSACADPVQDNIPQTQTTYNSFINTELSTKETTGNITTAPTTSYESVTEPFETVTVTAENTTEISSTISTTAPATKPAHIHNFSSATCTTAKTCSCGATEGKALGHNWNDATCTTPKTCTRCNKTSGSTTSHNYYNGSCTSCGKSDPNYVSERMVWIPTNGGTKYHSRSGCSNMIDPDYVTQSYAESLGFTPCKRCH